jgi:cilia- and flagella-associated protein 57
MCRFSHGGHKLAAINNTTIDIFHSYTYKHLASLKAHNGKVKSISWCGDDSRLVSCGVDGAVYEWDMHTYTRVSESVIKANSYSSVSVSSDSDSIFVVGSDKTVKWISHGAIAKEVGTKNDSSPEITLTQVWRIMQTSNRYVHI